MKKLNWDLPADPDPQIGQLLQRNRIQGAERPQQCGRGSPRSYSQRISYQSVGFCQ